MLLHGGAGLRGWVVRCALAGSSGDFGRAGSGEWPARPARPGSPPPLRGQYRRRGRWWVGHRLAARTACGCRRGRVGPGAGCACRSRRGRRRWWCSSPVPPRPTRRGARRRCCCWPPEPAQRPERCWAPSPQSCCAVGGITGNSANDGGQPASRAVVPGWLARRRWRAAAPSAPPVRPCAAPGPRRRGAAADPEVEDDGAGHRRHLRQHGPPGTRASGAALMEHRRLLVRPSSSIPAPGGPEAGPKVPRQSARE